MVSGSTAAQRTITASFSEVDGTALSNPNVLIHWWTSGTQTGSAAVAAASTTYAIIVGTNVVNINNSGSINHAMTDANGKFAVRLTSTAGAGASTFWFNTEVQGIVYSISSTLNNNA